MLFKCVRAAGLALVVLTGMLQFSAAAHATGAGKSLAFHTNTSLQFDDNFRLAIAGQEVAERIYVQTLGVNWSVPVSLQQFDLNYEVNINKHQNFASADFMAQNYRAAWQWSYTPRLHGSLYTSRAETLNAIQDNLNTALRNKNTNTSSGLSISYGLAGPWSIQGGMSTSRSVNEQALIGGGDSDLTAVSIGLRYSPSPRTVINYNHSRSRGNSSSSNELGAVLASHSISASHSLSVDWTVSPKTSLSANLKRQTNTYDSASAYDFSSVSGGISMAHSLTAKTSLSLNLQRQLSSKQTTTASFSQTDQLSIAAQWQVTPKLKFSLPYSVTQVSDQGSPLGVNSNQQDTFYSTNFSLGWQPRPFAALVGSVGLARRKSNLPGLDYVSTKSAINANFNF